MIYKGAFFPRLAKPASLEPHMSSAVILPKNEILVNVTSVLE